MRVIEAVESNSGILSNKRVLDNFKFLYVMQGGVTQTTDCNGS